MRSEDLPQGLGCEERGLEYGTYHGNARNYGAGVWVDSSTLGTRKVKQKIGRK